ncbi:hypothetical protein [Salinimicrobium sediminilitoris]|uniref:hypothetical protein n=1 Tax=Salinimicrobium sediminilitoris TaxID=2876715 RepID=UPI001E368114|nr:hypothetical protein [Salinimicrobium sediminilitoris]MCC8360264.1 hypothetical protein [Salinimicrobium sediminilitoris]
MEIQLPVQDTLNQVVSDTLIKVSDTINLKLLNTLELFQGDDQLIVKTISEPTTGIEYWGLLIAIGVGILTAIYNIIASKKLLSNDKQLQSQINELVKLNQLFERRLRMSVKPHLFINSIRTMGVDRTLGIELNNRGEIAFYSGCEILKENAEVTFQGWKKDIEIEKGGRILLSGKATKNPSHIQFQMKIKYYDQENYQYESIINWDRGSALIIETKEL